MSNLPEVKDVSRATLNDLGNGIAAAKAGKEREVSDLDAQIEKLQRDKASKAREAHVLDVKQKAIRAAIRVIEDSGII